MSLGGVDFPGGWDFPRSEEWILPLATLTKLRPKAFVAAAVDK